MHVYQTKIFADNFKEKISADGAFNKWMLNHKNIQIIEFKYNVNTDFGCSICILYKEEV